MRHHYAYFFKGSDPAPRSGGDTKSWLEYYKLSPEAGEVYFAVPESESPKVGGLLWLVLDEKIVACAEIVLVVPDLINNNVEVWFRSSEVKRLNDPIALAAHRPGFRAIDAGTGEAWYSKSF